MNFSGMDWRRGALPVSGESLSKGKNGADWPQFDVTAVNKGSEEDRRAAALAQKVLDSMPADVRQRIFDESVRLGVESVTTGRAFDPKREAARIAEELAREWLLEQDGEP